MNVGEQWYNFQYIRINNEKIIFPTDTWTKLLDFIPMRELIYLYHTSHGLYNIISNYYPISTSNQRKFRYYLKLSKEIPLDFSMPIDLNIMEKILQHIPINVQQIIPILVYDSKDYPKDNFKSFYNCYGYYSSLTLINIDIDKQLWLSIFSYYKPDIESCCDMNTNSTQNFDNTAGRSYSITFKNNNSVYDDDNINKNDIDQNIFAYSYNNKIQNILQNIIQIKGKQYYHNNEYIPYNIWSYRDDDDILKYLNNYCPEINRCIILQFR